MIIVIVHDAIITMMIIIINLYDAIIIIMMIAYDASAYDACTASLRGSHGLSARRA